MPYDIFISYSRRDNEQGRITELVDRIKADFAPFAKRDLLPFFDQQDIDGMQDWKQRILQGLRESRLLLACLSPAYLKSEYCEWEFVEYLKYEIGHLHGFNGVAPIYFVEVPGWDNKDFEQQCAAWVAELRRRQNFDLRPWHDLGEAALRDGAVQERMGKLNHQIVQTITRGERADNSLGNVDAHNPHFIGRTANLRMLRENFVTPGHIGVVTAVNGVGGLGKTALAIEYGHAFADEYGGGRWQVRCAGRDDLRLALAELATPIGFEFTDDEKKNADLQFERIRRELKKLADTREPHRCLLILDNVDRAGLLDPAQVARLNGGDWLHVLATTRLGENELHGAHRDRSFLAIDELPPEDALVLIESYQPNGRFRSETERDAARETVRLLGSFTLAVESTAVYLGQFANDVTCVAFLARLKKEGLEGLDAAAGQSSEGVLHGEKRLSATLEPTLERLGAAEKLALEFAALLPPDQVPLPWLRALVAKTFPEMERDAEPGYPDPWKNILRRLFSLRLLQATDAADEDGQTLVMRMHRLVGELVRSNLQDSAKVSDCVESHLDIRCNELQEAWHLNQWEIAPLIAFAQDLLVRRAAIVPTFMRSLCQWLPSFDHGRNSEPLLRATLVQIEEHPTTDPLDLTTTLSNLAWALQCLGRFSEAEEYLRRALELDESAKGPDEGALAIRCNQLAGCLSSLGRPADAECYARRALEHSEREYGPNRYETLVCVGWVAAFAWNRGNLTDGEALFRREFDGLEKLFGFDHPATLRAAIVFSKILDDQGDSRGAESLCRRAVESEKRIFGPEHSITLGGISTLGVLLRRKGDYTDAETMLRHVLECRDRTRGPEHPATLESVDHLAVLLTKKGDYTSAERLFRRALDGRERVFGPEHPESYDTTAHLAELLREKGDYVGAEPLCRRVLEARERAVGPEHPSTQIAMVNLAVLLTKKGEYASAEPLFQRALEGRKRLLGPEHRGTQWVMEKWAEILVERGDYAGAEPLYRQVMETRERILGKEHPLTVESAKELAGVLEAVGRFDEAAPLLERVLDVQERMLGEEHSDTLIRMNNLAFSLGRKGDYMAAEPVFRRVLATRERVLGPEHPQTLGSVNSLALFLERKGDYVAAEPLLRRALEARERVLGWEHPDTLASGTSYSATLRKRGRAEPAEMIDRRVVATTANLLGDIHPRTIHSRNNLVLTLVMLGKLEEARHILATNWRLNAPLHANTTPRVAFLRHIATLLESQPDTPFLGELKTLLIGLELPMSSDVAVPWDIAYFVEYLRPKLPVGAPEFLTALVAAQNDRAKLPELDHFTEWRDQAPLPLETPWPET